MPASAGSPGAATESLCPCVGPRATPEAFPECSPPWHAAWGLRGSPLELGREGCAPQRRVGMSKGSLSSPRHWRPPGPLSGWVRIPGSIPNHSLSKPQTSFHCWFSGAPLCSCLLGFSALDTVAAPSCLLSPISAPSLDTLGTCPALLLLGQEDRPHTICPNMWKLQMTLRRDPALIHTWPAAHSPGACCPQASPDGHCQLRRGRVGAGTVPKTPEH